MKIIQDEPKEKVGEGSLDQIKVEILVGEDCFEGFRMVRGYWLDAILNRLTIEKKCLHIGSESSEAATKILKIIINGKNRNFKHTSTKRSSRCSSSNAMNKMIVQIRCRITSTLTIAEQSNRV